jgi:hypothetical protein
MAKQLILPPGATPGATPPRVQGGALINRERAAARLLALPPIETSIEFPAVIPNDGVIANMEIFIAAIRNGGLSSTVALFTNDVVPDASYTVSSFTAAAAGGLTAQLLGAPTSAAPDARGRVVWTWPESVFAATGPGLPVITYGFFVSYRSPITNVLRLGWCQRFQSPQGAYLVGNQVKFTLQIGGRQC